MTSEFLKQMNVFLGFFKDIKILSLQTSKVLF